MKASSQKRGEPLYRQIYQSLKNGISANVYAPDALLPSERELGILYQVDRITIRKALELLVEEGLVKKYPGAGTRVLGSASALARPAFNTLLYILPKSKIDRITEPFHSMLFYRLEAELRKHDAMLAYTVAEDPDRFRSKLSADGIAGILFVSAIEDAYFSIAEELSVPFAALNNPSAPMKYASFVADDEVGAYMATKHLIELGHRRVAMISGEKNYATSSLRERGFQRALNEAGLTDTAIVNSDWSLEGGRAAMEALLATSVDRRITAVVVANDYMAFGAMQALRAAKIEVPSQMSVIGFDDMPFSSMSDPALSTVRVDIENMAKNAVRYLYEVITTGEALSFRLIVPVNLMIRDTTAAPPKDDLTEGDGEFT